MSNNKAQKTQLQFPLLYNLAKDTPHVDSTFRSVEEINAPLLNNMIMPVYNKATGKKAVYDNKGNRYYYNTSTHKLVKEALDGTTTELHSYYNNNLEKNNITDQMQGVVSLDINGNNQTIVKVREDGLTVDIDGKVSSHSFQVQLTLLENSRIVEVRTKYLDDNNVLTVIYYDYQGTEKIYVYRNETPIITEQNVTWYKQFPTTNGTISMPTTIPIGGIAPCIHISKPVNDYYVISLTAKAGSVNDLIDGSVFASYIIDNSNNSVKIVGNDIKPANPTSTSGTETNATGVMITSSTSVGQSIIKVISANGRDWYYYNSNATNLTQCQKISFVPSNYDTAGKYVVGTQYLAPNASSNSSSSSSTTTTTTSSGSTSTSTSSSTSTTVAGSTAYTIYQFTVYTKTFNINFKGDGNLKYRVLPYGENNTIEVYNLSNYEIPQAGTNTSLGSGTAGTNYQSIKVWNTNIGATTGRTSISFTYRYLSGQPEPYIIPRKTWRVAGYNPITLEQVFNANCNLTDYLNTQDPWEFNYSKSVSTYGYSVYPNIWLDDGRSFALFSFVPNKWSNDNSTAYWGSTDGNFKIKGNMLLIGTGLTCSDNTYYVNTAASFDPSSRVPYIRSGSVSINQNFFDLTLKFNNESATDPLHLAQGVGETGGSNYLEININSASGVRFSPGTSRFTSFNYYSYAQYGDPTISATGEDLMIFTVGGSRAVLGNAFADGERTAPKWNLLYNVTTAGTSFVQGISISESADKIGTLVTPWQSIQESAYITFAPGKVIYKDKNNDWWEIKITNDIPELFTILDDRYIVVNTYEYLNAYDSFEGRMVHYATDYNGRLKHGQNSAQYWKGAIATSVKDLRSFPYIRTTANGINPLYYVMPRNPLCAPIYPLVSRYRVQVGSEIAPASATTSGVEEIDIFWSKLAQNACKYRYSIKESSQLATFINHNLQDLYYPGSSSASASLTPNMFTKYLDGAGNNDMVIEDFDAYVLTYYDSQAYLLYSASTQTTNQFGRNDVFFVIQGQFYGVIGDKLYALYYSNGAISNRDAIIDLGSIKFIGNNPMIAFWWDPVNRTIRSFTGDNNLDQLYSASKFTNIDGKGWYDKTTQSIFVNTDIGLLVFGPRNTYLLDKFQNVTNVQFSEDGVTHITSNGETYDMVYYKRDGYEIIPVNIETSFYGLGANEYTNIDRWDITLFDPTGEKNSSTIKVGIRTLTDVTVKSEEKELKINPNDYDNFSDSVLIRYVPKLQKGQGIRLYLKTPLTVQKIIPHIADEGHGTLTANRKGL